MQAAQSRMDRLSALWRIRVFMNPYTAAIQRDGDLWIGWVEEIPGVNAQGTTRQALLENLKSALTEALEMNRQDAWGNAAYDY